MKTHLALALCALATLAGCGRPATGQDLLRQQRVQPNQNSAQQNAVNALANLQLPRELANLTPQQLHQLAHLRELQLQQQAASGNGGSAAASSLAQNEAVAPPPIGAEALNVPQSPAPTGRLSAAVAASQAGALVDTNERHDDGTSASESTGADEAQPPTTTGAPSSAPGASQPGPAFEVNWNKCPQLEPSDSEKHKKTQVITKCLQSAPIPTNLTRENVEAHREQIATCALGVEGWFDESNNYRYDKAEGEIRAKKLESAIENQVLKFHVACKDEASKRFPREQKKLIDQVQFYQACMDYYISIVCEIEVSVDQ